MRSSVPVVRRMYCGIVAGVDVAQLARRRIEDADEERRVDRPGRVALDVDVDLARDRVEILTEREPRAQRRLDVRHEERGADALARDVADEQRDPAVGQREVVEEIAADFLGRHRDALDLGQPEAQRTLRQHVDAGSAGRARARA